MAAVGARTLRWSTVLWSVARLSLGDVRTRKSLHLWSYRRHGGVKGAALDRRCHTIGELTARWEVRLWGMRSSTLGGRTAIHGVRGNDRRQRLIEIWDFFRLFPLAHDQLLQRPENTDAVAFQASTNLEQPKRDPCFLEAGHRQPRH